MKQSSLHINVVYKEWNLNISRWKRLIDLNDPKDVWSAAKERCHSK